LYSLHSETRSVVNSVERRRRRRMKRMNNKKGEH
jgi:hypothetical protein